MTENIRQYVKSMVHDTRNRVNDDMKCVGKGLWYEDCIIHYRYLQPIITQYFIDNKSEIWLLFLIAHSKR